MGENPIHLGMTGTRNGMTQQQKASFVDQLLDLRPNYFHHGDCIGADEDAYKLVFHFRNTLSTGIWIVCHPPIKTKTRAFTRGNDESWPVKDYLVRDRDIVNQSDVLIGFPKGTAEERRSGTWATIRMARERGIERRIIWPSGEVTVERPNSLLA